jgi:hypothetical protein
VRFIAVALPTWPFVEYLQDKAMSVLYALAARLRGGTKPTVAAWLEMRNGTKQIVTAVVVAELAKALLAQTEEPRDAPRLVKSRSGRRTAGPVNVNPQITIESGNSSGGEF